MNKDELLSTYNYLATGHCAFKSKSTIEKKMRCNHLLTITATCRFSDCPLVQPEYIAFQQQEEFIYLVEKKVDNPPPTMWEISELPEDFDAGLTEVNKRIDKYKDFSESLRLPIEKKLKILYERARTVKQAKSLDEEEETTE